MVGNANRRTAFLPALGVAVGLPIWRSRNAKNYKILVVLTLLTLANGVFHLAYLGVLPVGLMRIAGVVDFWLALLVIAALTHALRWLLWSPQSTWRNPLLLMLPVAYLWIPLSLAMRACAVAGTFSPVIAIHALTLGAISGLMLAMMMRSALGHTGRALEAGPFEIAAFLLRYAPMLCQSRIDGKPG